MTKTNIPPSADTPTNAGDALLDLARTRNLSARQLYVVANAGKTLGDYAKILDISTAAITGLVDSLEKKKLVMRKNSADRRVKKVITTPKGEAIATEYKARCDELSRGRWLSADNLPKIGQGLVLLKLSSGGRTLGELKLGFDGDERWFLQGGLPVHPDRVEKWMPIPE